MTREIFEAKLRPACAQHGISLQKGIIEPLFAYFEEIFTWNERINLIGRREKDCFIERHLVDSLCALGLHIGKDSTMLDLGSGNGLPGIPLAIVLPGACIDLLESNTKRCTFLQHVVSRLDLKNTTVRCGRFEDLHEHMATFQYILVRGIKVSKRMAEMIQSLLDHRGTLILYRGEHQGFPNSNHSAISVVAGVKGRKLIAIKNTMDFTLLFDA